MTQFTFDAALRQVGLAPLKLPFSIINTRRLHALLVAYPLRDALR